MQVSKLFLFSALCLLFLATFTQIVRAEGDEEDGEEELVEEEWEQPLDRSARDTRSRPVDRDTALGNCRSDGECRRGQVCRYVGRSLLKRCQNGQPWLYA